MKENITLGIFLLLAVLIGGFLVSAPRQENKTVITEKVKTGDHVNATPTASLMSVVVSPSQRSSTSHVLVYRAPSESPYAVAQVVRLQFITNCTRSTP